MARLEVKPGRLKAKYARLEVKSGRLKAKPARLETKTARVEADHPFGSKSIYFRNSEYIGLFTLEAKVVNGVSRKGAKNDLT